MYKIKFKFYSDLPGFQVAGGSMPPEIFITNLKPDKVVIDVKTKQLFILELTVPFETNIELRHFEKSNNYAHFQTDITAFETFETVSLSVLKNTQVHSSSLICL
jgi:hypothetical protein